MNQINSMDETDKISYSTDGISGLTSGLKHFSSKKPINTADGSASKVIGITEAIEIKVAETVANLSFIITYVSNIEDLQGLDWFDQTKVVLDPARRFLKIPSKNIKLDSENESDFKTEINTYLADQEQDEIFSDDILDYDSKFELKKTNLKFELETTTETAVVSNSYRQPNTVNDDIKAEVKKMLDAGIIRTGKAGRWASPAKCDIIGCNELNEEKSNVEITNSLDNEKLVLQVADIINTEAKQQISITSNEQKSDERHKSKET
ncbi:unnamed protein product [Brachionus calyciflorus]|uniref:Uncharacterized protein n=1 Tax=Brachionus calyciflorus TaxID=104777 RepID=A0A813V774_9BILA|nr:unnamed protein product [Brachionus calyciflorus]